MTEPLRPGRLHGSVADPLLGSMNFLNEVMDRYPDAISMAPGAPNERFLADVDVPRCLDAFERHLRGLGHDDAGVRRVLYQYGPSRGQINRILADALARDEGIRVPPETIVVTAGAQEAMFLALRVLHATPGDALAVTCPAYVGISGAARLLDLPVIPVPDLGDGPDPDALVRACAQGARTLYVAPDHANPGGTRMSLPARRRLLDLADRHDLLILEDSAYGFTAAERLPTLKALDERRRVLHIGTFAKICLPGARVGYIVADQPVDGGTGPHPLADELAAAKSMVTVNTSPIAQAVVAGMILDHGGSLARVAGEKTLFYRRNLAVLLDALRQRLGPLGVSWTEPDGGFFVRVRLPVPADDALLERSARDHGVLWTPMRHFHLCGDGAYELRLSCSYLDDDEIEEGVARLAKLIQDLKE